MKNLKLSAIAVAVTLVASVASATFPAGSWGGSSQLLSGPDVMALIVKKDPANPAVSYAILAEYTRLPYIPGPERLEITKWVPRMYLYKVEEASPLRYTLRPLRAAANGDVEVDSSYSSEIVLKKSDSLVGAVLKRSERGGAVAETVTFDGKVSSTWEKFVPGNYFGTKDNSGNDYLRKDVNTVLSKDQLATFDQKDVVGVYQMTEKLPGIFTFQEKSSVKGRDQILSRLAVFVDIVNWKPFFTTDELLLINPDDAKDVGFYYERH